MIYRLKNITANPLMHSRSSIGLPVNEYVVINETDRWYFQPQIDNSEMWNLFVANSVRFNDGSTDYTNAYEGFHRFLYAFGVPFLTEPNRANTFPAAYNTVQTAIEYARNITAGGALGIVACGFDGTGSSGRWLEFITNQSSNDTPWVVANTSFIAALALSGSRTSTYTGTVTVYRNNVAIETISLTNQYKNIKIGLSHLLSPLDEIKFQVTSGSIAKPTIWIYTGA